MTDHIVQYTEPSSLYCPTHSDRRYPTGWRTWPWPPNPVYGQVSYLSYEYFGHITSDVFLVNDAWSPKHLDCDDPSSGVVWKDRAGCSPGDINHPNREDQNILYADSHVGYKLLSDCEPKYAIDVSAYAWWSMW
jgi:hypothetical protein